MDFSGQLMFDSCLWPTNMRYVIQGLLRAQLKSLTPPSHFIDLVCYSFSLSTFSASFYLFCRRVALWEK